MKTIAQQLNIKTFPFFIKDSNGNPIYSEHSDGSWAKYEYDADNKVIRYEDSDGRIGTNAPKQMSKKPLICSLKKDC